MFRVTYKNEMIPLLDKICQILDCGRADLPEAMQNIHVLTRLTDYLSTHGHLITSHLRNNKEVVFDAFCLRGAATQIIWGNVTVATYMRNRHHIELQYPMLPLIAQFGNNSHIDYFPIELLNYQRRQPNFYKKIV